MHWEWIKTVEQMQSRINLFCTVQFCHGPGLFSLTLLSFSLFTSPQGGEGAFLYPLFSFSTLSLGDFLKSHGFQYYICKWFLGLPLYTVSLHLVLYQKLPNISASMLHCHLKPRYVQGGTPCLFPISPLPLAPFIHQQCHHPQKMHIALALTPLPPLFPHDRICH